MKFQILAGASSAMLTCVFFLTGCASDRTNGVVFDSASTASDAVTDVEAAINDEPIDSERVTLVVYGMSCPLCATNVDKQLLAVDGVTNVEVDLSTGRIDVALADSPRPTTRQLASAVTRSGFTLMDITLN
jgi:copper chaperone